MFSQISWSNYILIVMLLLAGYYLVIGYLYYRNDFLRLIVNKKNINHFAEDIQYYSPLIQSFSDELQAFLSESGKNKTDKEDMLVSLQMLLKKYPNFSESDSWESVQNLIINQSKYYCSIDLNNDDLSILWN